MKKVPFIALIVTLLFKCGLMAAFAAPKTYILDSKHTFVLWHISHFGFSSQAGKWYASGKLTLDHENPANSKVDATIDVTDMITGIPALDKHLKGKLFFDTTKYPKATFVSDKVEVTEKSTAKVHGILTIRGVSKPVVLDVKLNQEGINPISDNMSAGFSATTEIKRSEFGMTTLAPGLSDDVKLNIEVEAYLPKST